MMPTLSPPDAAGSAPRWRLSAGQQLQCHRWDDDEIVLYNDLAGDTHLLDRDALDVLHLLRDAPDSADGLAARLALDQDQAAILHALLDTLRKLALIEYRA